MNKSETIVSFPIWPHGISPLLCFLLILIINSRCHINTIPNPFSYVLLHKLFVFVILLQRSLYYLPFMLLLNPVPQLDGHLRGGRSGIGLVINTLQQHIFGVQHPAHTLSNPHHTFGQCSPEQQNIAGIDEPVILAHIVVNQSDSQHEYQQTQQYCIQCIREFEYELHRIGLSQDPDPQVQNQHCTDGEFQSPHYRIRVTEPYAHVDQRGYHQQAAEGLVTYVDFRPQILSAELRQLCGDWHLYDNCCSDNYTTNYSILTSTIKLQFPQS